MIKLQSILAAAIGISSATVSLHAADAPDIPAIRAKAKAIFPPLPDKMPGAEKDTPAQVTLGKSSTLKRTFRPIGRSHAIRAIWWIPARPAWTICRLRPAHLGSSVDEIRPRR